MRARRPSLLFAARRPPHPLDSGGRIRTFHLLTGLAQTFDTTLLTLQHAASSPDGHCDPGELALALPGIETLTVPAPPARKRERQVASLARSSSWTMGRYAVAVYRTALRGAAADRQPCIVHFDDLGVAPLGPVDGALNVYCSHNVEQTILRLGAAVGSPARRAFNRIEAAKVAREEQRVWRSMDLSLAVSPFDAGVMRAAGASRVELCPNGAVPVARLPFHGPAEGEALRLLFVGSGAYAPYERGLAWLIGEVLPRVRSRMQVAFDVVGQPPADPVAGAGIRYWGRVPDVRPFYEACHAVVVPMFEGSGTRLKVLEAMAYGRPVVSTPRGVEGLPCRADEHFLLGADAQSFAAALSHLDWWSRRPETGELEQLLAAAREAVAPLFWPRVVERLVALYESEFARLREAGGAAGAGVRTDLRG